MLVSTITLRCTLGFGLLWWFTPAYTPSVIVVPFLVMAVGVDDAFLLINSWQNVMADRRTNAKRMDKSDILATVFGEWKITLIIYILKKT